MTHRLPSYHRPPRKGFKRARDERLDFARDQFNEEFNMGNRRAVVEAALVESGRTTCVPVRGGSYFETDSCLVLVPDAWGGGRTKTRGSSVRYVLDLAANRLFRTDHRGSNNLVGCQVKEAFDSAWIMRTLSHHERGRKYLEDTHQAPWKTSSPPAKIEGVPKHHSKLTKSGLGKIEATKEEDMAATKPKADLDLIEIETNVKRLILTQRNHEVRVSRKDLIRLLRKYGAKEVPSSCAIELRLDDGKVLCLDQGFVVAFAWTESEEREEGTS